MKTHLLIKLSHPIFLMMFAFAFSLVTTSQADDDASIELAPAVQRRLDEKVIAPFTIGNMPEMIAGITDLVHSSSPELLSQIDSRLTELGYSTLGKLATNVWIENIEQGAAAGLPKLSWQMAQQILPRIKLQIIEQLNQQKLHPLMRDPIEYPADFAGFEAGLWDLHVFDRQLQNAIVLAESADKLIKPFQRKFDGLSGNEQEKKLDFAALAVLASQQQSLLAEHEAEVRIYRMENAALALADSKDFETRLRAAFALEYDAVALDAFFKSHPQPIRDALQGDQLQQNVQALVKQGRDAGQDVIHKAALLNVGLHWWVRGRYGAGPLRWGLLKSPHAIESAAKQFPLYMPIKPVATDPANSRSLVKSPQVDRRHHYIWAVEYQEIQSSARSTSHSTSTRDEKLVDGSIRQESGSFY
jgi:hypothetical protein